MEENTIRYKAARTFHPKSSVDFVVVRLGAPDVWPFRKSRSVGSIPTPVGESFSSNGKFSTGPLGVSCVVRCLMLVIVQSVELLVEDGVLSF